MRVSPATPATVGERRDAKQQRLIEAAAAIASEQGVTAVTVGAVAARAGIARSTVYSYFNSGSDLIADVLVDELMQMVSHLHEQVAPAENPTEAVHLWIRAALRFITDGRHALVRAASSVDFPPTRKAQIGALHRQLVAPLVQAFGELGIEDPMRASMQVNSVVEVCVRRIETGMDPQTEILAAEQFILRGLDVA